MPKESTLLKECLNWDQISSLQYQFHKLSCKNEPSLKILSLVFSGRYHPDPRGLADARLILAVTRAALELWPSSHLIFDLRGLHFQGGEAIISAFQHASFHTEGRLALVVSQHCRGAFIELSDFTPRAFGSPEMAYYYLKNGGRCQAY